MSWKEAWYFVADRWWALWYGFSGLWSARRRDTIISACMMADFVPSDLRGASAWRVQLYYDADRRYSGGVAEPVDDDDNPVQPTWEIAPKTTTGVQGANPGKTVTFGWTKSDATITGPGEGETT